MQFLTLSRPHSKLLVRGLFIAAIAAVLVFVCVTVWNQPGSPVMESRSAPAQMAATAAEPTNDARAQEMESLQLHLQQKPEHTPILFRMAQLSRELGKLNEAAEYLREILRQEPDNTDARLELGRVLYELGDAAGAVQETEQVLTKNPRHVDALYNLGAIYANRKQTELAREYWMRAVASDAQSESGQNARRGLEQLGQREPSRLSLDKESIRAVVRDIN
jgi:tetratricopeptide (TPR) repeat protein